MSTRRHDRSPGLVPVLVPILGLALAGLAPRDLAARPAFVEAPPEGTGLDFVHFNGMSGELYYSEHVGPGVALLDYDRDGDLDAYVGQGHMLGDRPLAAATFAPRDRSTLSDRLFRNDTFLDAQGRVRLRFVDVTESSALVADGYAMGVATGDYDGDGWVDLYVTNLGPNQLWRNRGDGSFEDVTDATGTDDPRWSTSASFLDYDDDGHLDLFVTNYVAYRPALQKPCLSASGSPDYCGPLSYAPEGDRLWRNRGDGTFADVTGRAGLLGARGNGLGVATGDFDGDGLVDLYVANDYMRNNLWLNQGDGSFVDDALLAGVAANAAGEAEASMGVVAGDLDDDGDEDLFMTHLTGETNTLYANDGTAMFRDRSAETGVGSPSFPLTGFGVATVDFDADGSLDLAIANGAVVIQADKLAAGDPFPLGQRNQLFRNVGNGAFVEVETAGATFEREEVSRSLASGDVDLDGDVDLLLANNAGPLRLLLSKTPSGSWLGLSVLGPSGAPDLGARIVVSTSDRTIHRRVRTDGSYCAASDPRIFAGLGSAESVSAASIVGANGRRLVLRELPVRRTVTVPPPQR